MLQQDSHLQQQLDSQVVISCLKFEQKKISLYLSTSTDNFNSFKSTDTLADGMLTRGLPPLLMIIYIINFIGELNPNGTSANGTRSPMRGTLPFYTQYINYFY